MGVDLVQACPHAGPTRENKGNKILESDPARVITCWQDILPAPHHWPCLSVSNMRVTVFSSASASYVMNECHDHLTMHGLYMESLCLCVPIVYTCVCCSSSHSCACVGLRYSCTMSTGRRTGPVTGSKVYMRSFDLRARTWVDASRGSTQKHLSAFVHMCCTAGNDVINTCDSTSSSRVPKFTSSRARCGFS